MTEGKELDEDVLTLSIVSRARLGRTAPVAEFLFLSNIGRERACRYGLQDRRDGRIGTQGNAATRCS